MSLGMNGRKRHYPGFAMLRVLVVHLAGQAEIDDFDVALAVDEDVGRLEVAMHNVPALRSNGGRIGVLGDTEGRRGADT